MTGEISALTSLLAETAQEAGALALSLQKQGVESWAKKDTTPVSNADLAVDALAKTRLLDAFPGHGWLSEETADSAARLEHRDVFIVDPIDGTRAYLKGKPEWVISLAAVRDNAPIAAAVFNPVTDELFVAGQGAGCTLNGASVRVSAAARLEGCQMIGYVDMFGRPEWPTPWPAMDISQKNAVAYRLALVAAGQADATLSMSLKHEWDTAGGALLVAEAGGLVTDHMGTPLRYNQPSPRGRSLIAAGPSLHGHIKRRVDFIPDERLAGL